MFVIDDVNFSILRGFSVVLICSYRKSSNTLLRWGLVPERSQEGKIVHLTLLVCNAKNKIEKALSQDYSTNTRK